MKETKKLPTTTIIEYKPDFTVDIISRYEGQSDTLPNIISSNVSEIVTNINNVPINEGDLFMNVKNYPNDINVQVDNDGNLVLFLNNPNEKIYSIDNNEGNLNYEQQ